jgi:hypothetical protein
MKPSRFTEEQIIGIQREQEACAATADVRRTDRTSVRYRGQRADDATVRAPACANWRQSAAGSAIVVCLC